MMCVLTGMTLVQLHTYVGWSVFFLVVYVISTKLSSACLLVNIFLLIMPIKYP